MANIFKKAVKAVTKAVRKVDSVVSRGAAAVGLPALDPTSSRTAVGRAIGKTGRDMIRNAASLTAATVSGGASLVARPETATHALEGAATAAAVGLTIATAGAGAAAAGVATGFAKSAAAAPKENKAADAAGAAAAAAGSAIATPPEGAFKRLLRLAFPRA